MYLEAKIKVLVLKIYSLSKYTSSSRVEAVKLLYFRQRIIRFSVGETETTDINWSEIGILFFLWVSICIALIKGIRSLRLVILFEPYVFR